MAYGTIGVWDQADGTTSILLIMILKFPELAVTPLCQVDSVHVLFFLEFAGEQKWLL